MHRRARHLNPGSAGAVLALDSRFITGLSDGDPVSTWSDRSGRGNNASQATTTKRPTYKTQIQGGQPTLDFDVVNRQWIGGNVILNTSSATCITMFTFNSSSQGYARVLTTSSGTSQDYNTTVSTTFHCRDITNNRFHVYRVGNALFSGVAVSTSAPTLASTVFNSSTCSFRLDGINKATANSTGVFNVDQYRCGWSLNVNDNSSDHFDGYQFCNQLFNFALSDPLLRRLEHSAAFAFKIPCS